jgi:hypothetical protein
LGPLWDGAVPPLVGPNLRSVLRDLIDRFDLGTPTRITRDTAQGVNLFPSLYRDFNGHWSLLWLSNRLGSPAVFELPLANVRRYPAGVVQNHLLSDGYSHRIAATATRNVYLGVWVQGAEGVQDIYARFFEVQPLR